MGVSHKVGFHNFIHPDRSVLPVLDVFFLDLCTLFGLVLAGQPADATRQAVWLELDLIGHVLELVHHRDRLDQGVLAHELLFVERIDPVLHVLERTCFSEVDLLDASDISVSFDELDVLDRRKHELGTDGVGVEDQGLEHP